MSLLPAIDAQEIKRASSYLVALYGVGVMATGTLVLTAATDEAETATEEAETAAADEADTAIDVEAAAAGEE